MNRTEAAALNVSTTSSILAAAMVNGFYAVVVAVLQVRSRSISRANT